MNRKALYFDDRYGFSSFLDKTLYENKPSDFEIVDYYSIGNWLDESRKGDVLVFGQDIVPYTAYEVTPYSQDSRLLRFLQRGGTVVWVGDVPFFYRLNCYDREMKEKLERTKEVLKKSVSFTPMPNFYLEKFGPHERGDKICVLDIMGGFYVDVENVVWIGLEYKHLGFHKLGDVCYLNAKRNLTKTFIGKLLNYESSTTIRPTKYSTRLYPLTLTTLEGMCKGKYAGSWIAEIGGGLFIRLYDDREDMDVRTVFRMGEIASSH